MYKIAYGTTPSYILKDFILTNNDNIHYNLRPFSQYNHKRAFEKNIVAITCSNNKTTLQKLLILQDCPKSLKNESNDILYYGC